jgi:gamma-glutamyltranspeptidase/glutathione hydrolase
MKRTVLCMMLLSTAAYAQDRDYGRSMVISDHGIVATSSPIASQAGIQILARGGSAMDAAIAANAVLGVAEPMMDGLGGDLFLLYWDAREHKLYGLNASGWAPTGLTVEYLKQKGFSQMPEAGIYSVTIPGVVDGWNQAHERFGRLPWSQLFTSAVYYAEHGYAVPEIAHDYWRLGQSRLTTTPDAERIYLPNDNSPALGQLFANTDLAKALRLVAKGGRDEFYQGEIAKAIVETSASLGGTITAADLSSFHSEWVEPISTTYRGWKVYELPPNGQGMAALEMLNIMGKFEADKSGPQGEIELHKKIEAMKLAYTDLYRYDADPRFAKIPVTGLLSEEYTTSRAASIDPGRANCAQVSGKPAKSDTTYFAAVDRDGNIASVIQSVYDYFGSGVVVKGMGFLLQDRGAQFVLDEGHPNALAPRKRPFHTIIPAFMEKGDEHIGFGIMGGSNQPLAHAQFVSNLVDYGMNIQGALSAPRFTIPDTGSDFIGCDILIESRVDSGTISALGVKGHHLKVRKAYSATMGKGQAVLHDSSTGMNFGASDPRGDGSAQLEPAP